MLYGRVGGPADSFVGAEHLPPVTITQPKTVRFQHDQKTGKNVQKPESTYLPFGLAILRAITFLVSAGYTNKQDTISRISFFHVFALLDRRSCEPKMPT